MNATSAKNSVTAAPISRRTGRRSSSGVGAGAAPLRAVEVGVVDFLVVVFFAAEPERDEPVDFLAVEVDFFAVVLRDEPLFDCAMV